MSGRKKKSSPAKTAVEVPKIERPDKLLLRLYALQSCSALVFFPFLFVPFYLRYRSLRYSFDEEGVGASWGILFRREVHLTYGRIQDIHVRQNVIERWLGIGRVELQTASGSAGAELVIEGIRQHAELRDFFYAKMRGTAGSDTEATQSTEPEAVRLLREIREELVRTRQALEAAPSKERPS